jgi:predicted enzyme related to lactoylglutathione lyase
MSKITALSFIVPVRELELAVAFYREAFGLVEVFRMPEIVFVGVPGSDSALGLLLDSASAGSGPQHVGFHLDHALELDDVLRDIESAGGKVVERGEHAPDVPFARIADPDGSVLGSEAPGPLAMCPKRLEAGISIGVTAGRLAASQWAGILSAGRSRQQWRCPRSLGR